MCEHDAARKALEVGDLIDGAWAKLTDAMGLAANMGDEAAWRRIAAAIEALAVMEGITGEEERPTRHRRVLEARKRWIDRMPVPARL